MLFFFSNVFKDYYSASIFAGRCLVNFVKSIVELNQIDDIFQFFFKAFKWINLSFIIRADSADSESNSNYKSYSSLLSSRSSSPEKGGGVT